MGFFRIGCCWLMMRLKLRIAGEAGSGELCEGKVRSMIRCNGNAGGKN
jgi:hypothetical protein